MEDRVKNMITEAVNDEFENNTYADYNSALACAVNRLIGYYWNENSVPMECLLYASNYAKTRWYNHE